MKAKCLLLLTVGLLLAADDPKDALKKDLAKLQGSWTTTSLMYNGQEKGGDIQLKFTFKDDVITIEAGEDIKKEYAKIGFKADPSTTPKCVDMTILAGVQKDAVIEGIYEIKDDELKICAKVFGKERPTEFKSPEASSIVLLVLKRDK